MRQLDRGVRPKILFLTRSLEIGGAERQLCELASGLHASGWDVRVAMFYGGGAFESRLRDAGIELIDLEKGGRWNVIGFALRLVKLLRKERPHIVHGYLDIPNIVLTALRHFAPGARVVWGVRASGLDSREYDFLCRVEVRLGALLSRFADLIICNSEAGRAHHIEVGYDAARMIVIPNGIDVQRFRPDAVARAESRAEWGVGEHEALIGVVGRLAPMKDQRNFLSAAAGVAASRPNVRFVCVGDGPEPYRRELVEFARSLRIEDRVVWAAARTDVWRIYNALDISVSSSRFGEGFPNAVAEAMASGVPCVVTDVGDSAAIVDDTGWVCPPGDSPALASALAAALRALPVETRRIRERIERNYGCGELLSRTAEHLFSLLSAGDPEGRRLEIGRRA